MAQPNLESLFQHIGPAAASAYAGGLAADSRYTQDIADQTSQAALAKAQQEAQQSSQMNPLLLQQQRDINTKGALANQFERQTQDNKVLGENAVNLGRVSKEKEDTATRMVAAVGRFGSQLESMPPLQRSMAVQQFMQENDIKPNGTMGAILTATPATELPATLQKLRAKMQETSDAAILQKQKDDAEYRKGELHNKGTANVAGIAAAASRYAADQRGKAKVVDPSVIAAKLGYEKGAAYYMIQSENAETPAEKQQFLDLARKFETAELNKRNAAAGTKPDLNPLGIATNPVVSAFGNNATPPPADLPTGAKQIGTSGGKPVYQLPNGSKIIGH